MKLDLKPYKNKLAQAGTAGSWIYALITLFAMIVLYSVFSMVVNPVVDVVRDEMITNNVSGISTLDTILTGWNNWILVMVFGVIIFVIVRAIAFERI